MSSVSPIALTAHEEQKIIRNNIKRFDKVIQLINKNQHGSPQWRESLGAMLDTIRELSSNSSLVQLAPNCIALAQKVIRVCQLFFYNNPQKAVVIGLPLSKVLHDMASAFCRAKEYPEATAVAKLVGFDLYYSPLFYPPCTRKRTMAKKFNQASRQLRLDALERIVYSHLADNKPMKAFNLTRQTQFTPQQRRNLYLNIAYKGLAAPTKNLALVSNAVSKMRFETTQEVEVCLALAQGLLLNQQPKEALEAIQKLDSNGEWTETASDAISRIRLFILKIANFYLKQERYQEVKEVHRYLPFHSRERSSLEVAITRRAALDLIAKKKYEQAQEFIRQLPPGKTKNILTLALTPEAAATRDKEVKVGCFTKK